MEAEQLVKAGEEEKFFNDCGENGSEAGAGMSDGLLVAGNRFCSDLHVLDSSGPA